MFPWAGATKPNCHVTWPWAGVGPGHVVLMPPLLRRLRKKEAPSLGDHYPTAPGPFLIHSLKSS